MAAVLADRMDSLSGWQNILQIQIREIESRHPYMHGALIDWGVWGRSRDHDVMGVVSSRLWSLPGDPDPDRDPDAMPPHRHPPIDEKRVLALDSRINSIEYFPALWRKVACVNYLGVKRRRDSVFERVVLPEWQRPNAAGISEETYRIALGGLLRHLSCLTNP